MTEILRKINEISPFTWEIVNDGDTFTILCEGAECRDPRNGKDLTNMTASECAEELETIVNLTALD